MQASPTLSCGCIILEAKGPVIFTFTSLVCRVQGFLGGLKKNGMPARWRQPPRAVVNAALTGLQEGKSLPGFACPQALCSEATIQKRRRARELSERSSVGDDLHLHGRALCQLWVSMTTVAWSAHNHRLSYLCPVETGSSFAKCTNQFYMAEDLFICDMFNTA